jgi:hypothetical protein
VADLYLASNPSAHTGQCTVGCTIANVLASVGQRHLAKNQSWTKVFLKQLMFHPYDEKS